jgi:hypothetical protein
VRGFLGLVLLVAACGDSSLKAQGESCFGSSECAEGLTCDFGQTPSVCATSQTQRPPDAAPTPQPDADPNQPDADLSIPDATPTPDAMPGVPDAMPAPDAALPDATPPDAGPLPDAI